MRKLKLLAVIPFALLLCTSCTKTVDLNQYLSFEYSGYDGDGCVEVNIDTTRMIEDNMSAFGLKKNYSASDLSSVKSGIKNAGTLGTTDKNMDLSNGDEIAFTWNQDALERIEEHYTVKFDVEDVVQKVDQLEETTTINPFDYITMLFSLRNDETYSVRCDDSRMPCSRVQTYQIELSSGEDYLHIGDEVTVYIREPERVIRTGYRFTETEKTYKLTPDELPHYLNTLDAFPKDTLEAMDEVAQKEFMDEIQRHWDHPENYYGADLLGCYLFEPDKTIDLWYGGNIKHNICVLVYQMNAIDDYKYYACCAFSDMLMKSNGECTYTTFGMDSHTFMEDGKYEFYGYQYSKDAMNEIKSVWQNYETNEYMLIDSTVKE